VPESARPTSGRAREALFSILSGRLPGARVLDLFAGSGAIGLEAVSRGAASAVLVESDARALRRSVEALPDGGGVRLLERTAEEAVAELLGEKARFDIVFADPPYDLGPAGAALGRVAALLEPGGILAVQLDAGQEPGPVPGMQALAPRAYGRNVFHFFAIR
jgi:16S rRNA (guanine966-N2)-methyltransferase